MPHYVNSLSNCRRQMRKANRLPKYPVELVLNFKGRPALACPSSHLERIQFSTRHFSIVVILLVVIYITRTLGQHVLENACSPDQRFEVYVIYASRHLLVSDLYVRAYSVSAGKPSRRY